VQLLAEVTHFLSPGGCDERHVRRMHASGSVPSAWWSTLQTVHRGSGTMRGSMASPHTFSVPKIGDRMPDVVLPSVDESRAIRLSDFRGRRVLVFMWASW
jgi:hypothetical protein